MVLYRIESLSQVTVLDLSAREDGKDGSYTYHLQCTRLDSKLFLNFVLFQPINFVSRYHYPYLTDKKIEFHL